MQSKLFIHVVGDGGRISDIVPRSRRRPRNEAYTVARRRQMTAVSPEGSETMEQRRRRNPRHMWMRWDWILAVGLPRSTVLPPHPCNTHWLWHGTSLDLRCPKSAP
ncbi:hypothetical protein GW17_00050691 [Ensete ventricosum]|nr:hypothetical protein GW17_00050691 [Ensete ventricosum]